MKDLIRIIKKVKCLFILLAMLTACSTSTDRESISVETQKELISGQNIQINYDDYYDYNKVNVKLKSRNTNDVIENYGQQDYNDKFYINRFLNKDIAHFDIYYFQIDFTGENKLETKEIDININPSIIVESFCATDNCNSLSGNIVQNTINKLRIKTFKIAPVNIEYIITTPYNSFKINHEFNSPVNEDWIEDIVFNEVPVNVSSYINSILIKAYDNEGNYAETALPFKVVRPIEVKHFGEYELAETYEPLPVTGCIPGTIGNNVQYSESQTETRQNSVAITINNSWSNSNSSNTSLGKTEGISINETNNTVSSSSLSQSETVGENSTESYSESEAANINFNTTDGETWGWDIGESESQGSSSSNTNNTNLGVNGSVTTGFSGEGSLPFLAKASGKVEVTAGVSAGWGSSNTELENQSNTTSRGYSTGGSSQNGKSFGSSQNESRSHSLTGSYVLSSSTSNTITESSALSSGRVWNMSENISSGKVVTEGNSESLAKTISDTTSSSTIFSYSAYIPRGRFGIFYRQTSRFVKLSEVITYDLNGYAKHAGYITMNSWAWAPEMAIGESCEDLPKSNLPEATCHIPPCGE
jgi:hypothetical protein